MDKSVTKRKVDLKEEPKAPWEKSRGSVFSFAQRMLRAMFMKFGAREFSASILAMVFVAPLIPLALQVMFIRECVRLVRRSTPLAHAKAMLRKSGKADDRLYFLRNLKAYISEYKAKQARKAAEEYIIKALSGGAEFNEQTAQTLEQNEKITRFDYLRFGTKSIFGFLFFRPLGGAVSAERFIILRNVSYVITLSVLSSIFLYMTIISLGGRYSPVAGFSLSSMLSYSLLNNTLSHLVYSFITLVLSFVLFIKTKTRMSRIDEVRKKAFKNKLITVEEYENDSCHIIFCRNPGQSDSDTFFFRLPNLAVGFGAKPEARISQLSANINMLRSGGNTFRVTRGRTVFGSGNSELILLNSPEKRPPIFSSDKFSITSKFAIWRYFAVNAMKREYKRTGVEHLLWGEIVDPTFEGDNHILLSIDADPHLAIIGRSGSGKTRTSLSIVLSLKYAYPDSIMYFSDGKSSGDYDGFANYCSTLPVAKNDTIECNDPLMKLANILTKLNEAFEDRRKIFEKAGVSSINEYRAAGGVMPRIFAFFEEFAVFRNFINWDAGWKEPGTLANVIKRMVAEARFAGIHLIFISQRYQDTDLPTEIRSNLTFLIHQLEQQDGDQYLKQKEAKVLARGYALATASGVSTPEGNSFIKVAVPFIGDDVQGLLREHIKPIPAIEKQKYNFNLIYKLSNDVEKISKASFGVRVSAFLQAQNWKTTQIISDTGADNVQYEAVKSYREKSESKDGSIVENLVPYPDADIIGVALLDKATALNPDTLFDIQDRHDKYKVIVIFLMEQITRGERTEIEKLIADANERGSRFLKIEKGKFDELSKKIALELKQSGRSVDVIKQKVVSLLGFSVEGATSSLPISVKIEHLLERSNLKLLEGDRIIKSTPVIKAKGPAGRVFCFVVGGNAKDLDVAAREVALDMSSLQGHVVFFIQVAKAEDKKLVKAGVTIISKERVNELYGDQNGSTVLSSLIKLSGLVSNSEEEMSYIPISKGATIEITSSFSRLTGGQIDNGSKVRFGLKCWETGIPLLYPGEDVVIGIESKHEISVDVDSYKAENFGFLPDTKIVLRTGLAPSGIKPSNVRDSRKEKPSLKLGSGLSEDKGVLSEERPDGLFSGGILKNLS